MSALPNYTTQHDIPQDMTQEEFSALLSRVNLKEMTDDEICQLSFKIHALEEEGRSEEADILRNDVPVLANLANAGKEMFGIEELISSGINLSDAVRVYGYEWLRR